MKNDIATSIELSRLMEKAGVNAEYADMFYSKQREYDIYSTYVDERRRKETEIDMGNEVVPCWSMSRIFDLLPVIITINCVQCRMYVNTPDTVDGEWSISYRSANGQTNKTVSGITLFKAATSMLLYLIDNGILNYR